MSRTAIVGRARRASAHRVGLICSRRVSRVFQLLLVATWWSIAAAVTLASDAAVVRPPYSDGRPAATLRMDAKDHGIVLRYGDGPDRCDYLGAREAIVFEAGGPYYLHYDGA